MTKVDGKTWTEFYNDKDYWPEGRRHEDEIFIVNGKRYEDGVPEPPILFEEYGVSHTIEVIDGCVVDDLDDDFEPVSLDAYLQQWVDERKHAVLQVRVDRNNYVTALENIAGISRAYLASDVYLTLKADRENLPFILEDLAGIKGVEVISDSHKKGE